MKDQSRIQSSEIRQQTDGVCKFWTPQKPSCLEIPTDDYLQRKMRCNDNNMF